MALGSAVTITAGSRADVANSIDCTIGPPASASVRPTAPPMLAIRTASRTTSRATLAPEPPNAIRTPISCVRCDTRYDTTANSPTVAIPSARMPNAEKSVAPSRHDRSCGSMSAW